MCVHLFCQGVKGGLLRLGHAPSLTFYTVFTISLCDGDHCFFFVCFFLFVCLFVAVFVQWEFKITPYISYI